MAVSLNLTLSGGPVAGLQWTLLYPQADFTSVQFSLGSSAANAGKSLQCSSGIGSVTCVLVGLNDNDIAAGPVAVANMRLANATSSSPRLAARCRSVLASPIGTTCDAEATTVVPGSRKRHYSQAGANASVANERLAFRSAVQAILRRRYCEAGPSARRLAQSRRLGLYRAPAIVSATRQVTVTATNTSNSSFRATATVNLHPVTSERVTGQCFADGLSDSAVHCDCD